MATTIILLSALLAFVALALYIILSIRNFNSAGVVFHGPMHALVTVIKGV